MLYHYVIYRLLQGLEYHKSKIATIKHLQIWLLVGVVNKHGKKVDIMQYYFIASCPQEKYAAAVMSLKGV